MDTVGEVSEQTGWTEAGFPERWWAGEAGVAGRVLDWLTAPLELVYRGAVRVRNAHFATGRASTRVSAPVISVGNISVGGTGKTPVTRWIAEWYRAKGASPAVLHGGYAVDEPALHRRWNPDIPVHVGRDRIASAREAIAAGSNVLVLDDGFQHRRLERDLDLVLVAAERWSPSPRLLPRGPWRESLDALSRADLVAVTRKSASLEAARGVARVVADHTGGPNPVLVHLAPSTWTRAGQFVPTGPAGEAVVVAGIAGPGPFLENVRSAGVQLVDAFLYRDHHDYTAADADAIRTAAAGRAIVTTAKDAVKLAELDPSLELWVLEQDVIIEANGDRLRDRLTELLQRPGPAS